MKNAVHNAVDVPNIVCRISILPPKKVYVKYGSMTLNYHCLTIESYYKHVYNRQYKAYLARFLPQMRYSIHPTHTLRVKGGEWSCPYGGPPNVSGGEGVVPGPPLSQARTSSKMRSFP